MAEKRRVPLKGIPTFIFFIEVEGVLPPLKGITTVVLFIKEVGDTEGYRRYHIF
jgi:hypothetical protein